MHWELGAVSGAWLLGVFVDNLRRWVSSLGHSFIALLKEEQQKGKEEDNWAPLKVMAFISQNSFAVKNKGKGPWPV